MMMLRGDDDDIDDDDSFFYYFVSRLSQKYWFKELSQKILERF